MRSIDVADDLGRSLIYQTTPISAFFVAFHIFVMVERRDFIFDIEIDGRIVAYRWQTVPKRGAVMSRDPFSFLGPQPYLRNS